jgi:hypothetical protein
VSRVARPAGTAPGRGGADPPTGGVARGARQSHRVGPGGLGAARVSPFGRLRSSLVVLDGNGTLLSGSDNVLYRTGLDGGPPPVHYDAPCLIRQESVGGRFEPDGSFRGTRWLTEAEDRGGVDELEWKMTKSEPNSEDVAALRVLVAEIIRRTPSP